MTGIFKASIGPTQLLVIATGSKVAVPCRVHWIACTPSDPNAAWSLTDDLDGLSGLVYEHFDTDRHSEHIDFFPPLEFHTGLYVLSFLNMSSLTISYEY